MEQYTACSGPLSLVTIVWKDICLYSSSIYAYQPCCSVVGDLMRSNLGMTASNTLAPYRIYDVNGAMNSF
eukprot:scaffold5304_cov150-Skeletonema_marinoi.AAC.9